METDLTVSEGAGIGGAGFLTDSSSNFNILSFKNGGTGGFRSGEHADGGFGGGGTGDKSDGSIYGAGGGGGSGGAGGAKWRRIWWRRGRFLQFRYRSKQHGWGK